MYEIKSSNPTVVKWRSVESSNTLSAGNFDDFDSETDDLANHSLIELETINCFTNRVRTLQATAGNVKITNVSFYDKTDLLRRYLLEESQAELGMGTNLSSKNLKAAAEKTDKAKPISNKNLSDEQIFDQFKAIFGNVLSKEEIISACKKCNNVYDATVEELLKMTNEKEKLLKQKKLETKENNEIDQSLNTSHPSGTLDASQASLKNNEEDHPRSSQEEVASGISWGENPIKPNMSFEERKVALYNYAKARYIHKYGAINKS